MFVSDFFFFGDNVVSLIARSKRWEVRTLNEDFSSAGAWFD